MADSHAFARQPEELHIPAAAAAAAANGPRPSSSSASACIAAAAAQPPQPQHHQHHHSLHQHHHQPSSSSSSSAALPGALQPGPASLSSPVPPVLPTLAELAALPSAAMAHPHAYAASSPATFDPPRYKPFAPAPPSAAAHQYSPLGLADIRSHMESGLLDHLGASGGGGSGSSAQPPLNMSSGYLAPWGVYALDWCKWPAAAPASSAGRIALGSYLEDNHNYIQILDAQPAAPGGDPAALDFVKVGEATHTYPVTRIVWEPPSSQKQSTDLLATSGDHLRLWSLPADGSSQTNRITTTGTTTASSSPVPKLSPLALLSNSKSPEHTAPITSLDWNAVAPSLIITSSIDTTCTIWDIPTLTAKTQLIAHDREVYDVRFCAGSVDVFVSCGADGSVRMFDLRSLEHSTIIYEPSDKTDKGTPGNLSPSSSPVWPPPLLRIAASPHDAHLLATFAQDSGAIKILDVRQPGQALLELHGHAAAINCVEWCPTRRGTLASGADDALVLVWDLLGQSSSSSNHNNSNAALSSAGERGPAASWECEFEVSNVSWAPHGAGSHSSGWLGVTGGRGLWAVSL
ncbi:hypothetical protein LOZ58_001570 [Ophidiomyces ophidiicola]|nr:hypothetical protein LOZ58_001570 [Ophidiomyces ophidiicola]